MKPLEVRTHHLCGLDDNLQSASRFEKEFNQSPNERFFKPVAKKDGICQSCSHNPANLSSWMRPQKLCDLRSSRKYDQFVYPYLKEFFKIHNLNIENLTVGDFRSKPWLSLQAFLYLTDQKEVVDFNKKLRQRFS
jgi:hypothetical protein